MTSTETSQPKETKDAGIFRKKNLAKMLSATPADGHALKKTLGAFDLTVLGIGAIIGAGIFTLAGTAAAGSAGHVGAGPGLILSFVVSGIICGITALCYAEFASMIPLAGSAYTYTYTTLGEIVAWLVGWVLILGYGIGSISVACGWSGYLFQLLSGFKGILPDAIISPPFWLRYDYATAAVMYSKEHCAQGLQNFCSYAKPDFSYASAMAMHAKDIVSPDFPIVPLLNIPFSVNFPALFIVLVAIILLYIGIQESARMAAIMVLIKLVVIIAFICGGVFFIKPENYTPFLPNGFEGVFMGAFLVFFAYMGFDMVATTAEETKNPAKDLPIGIIASLIICTVIYILVAAVLTGMVRWDLIDVHSPIATAMAQRGVNWAAGVISVGAVAGLSSVILVQILAVTRILFAMARDGLLPKVFSSIHGKFHTPHVLTLTVGGLIAFGAIFIDINKAAELCNTGTLTAFSVVCMGVVILRYIEPDRHRPFRMPWAPVLPAIGALMSISLIVYTLFNTTSPLLLYYMIWLGVGLVIYFLHGRKHSTLKAEIEQEKLESNSSQ